jgi:hypothetical protein
MRSIHGDVEVRVKRKSVATLPEISRFASVAEASPFFEKGYLGDSATRKGDRLEGLELHTSASRVEPLDVWEVHSSYFADAARFPRGSIASDCALIMRNIPHHWRPAPRAYSLKIARAV